MRGFREKREQMGLMGLDVGSTTIKAVVLDDATGQVLFDRYFRHHADILEAMKTLVKEAAQALPGLRVYPAVTGSGGMSAAGKLNIPFVQEVIASTAAISTYCPGTDVVIELGGEDAKIIYITPSLEQRMNGSCAGGTGAFLDQMAALLKTNAAGLNDLAKGCKALYPIASRCGVFAKTDLQPLINEGAAKEDLAASVMYSVVNQTIAGLACGHRIEGNVVFLGGPLYYMSELRRAFENTLKDQVSSFLCPENAQLFVALGAALLARQQAGESLPIIELLHRFDQAEAPEGEVGRVRPLFLDDDEKDAFDRRHHQSRIPRGDIKEAAGSLFLGIDAGSTTTKAALLDREGSLVYDYYAGNQGDPVSCALEILKEIYALLPDGAYIASSLVTGYGEELIKAALKMDYGEIETVAHYRAASLMDPDVSFILDIGGQDMKCLHIKDGAIDSIKINEACSSGCGSFLQAFAQTLGLDLNAFTQAALKSQSPVDLGSRCTVFMNSRVKQAQREGAAVGDISAGLAYSVVRNALYKVMKIKSPEELGAHVVVQGGTFLNDAVLRTFELELGREVTRPREAGLMGALGAALIAKSRWQEGERSGILTPEEAEAFTMFSKASACGRCENRCRLTISRFPGGQRHISGNRCLRGEGKGQGSPFPDLLGYKYERLFDRAPLDEKTAPRGVMGVPRALNMYENYPFWHAFLTGLGFSVRLSPPSSHVGFKAGMDSIPSESVCYPAKLAHGHIQALLDAGCKAIFYPSVAYEQEEFPGAHNRFNCPIVTSYPEVILNNMGQIRRECIRFLHPFLDLGDRKQLPRLLADAFADYSIPRAEMEQALDKAYEADQAYRIELAQKGRETLAWMRENGVSGIVLAGRPYHCDPEINHGLPQLITSLGMAVLTEESVAYEGELERPLRVVDQWAYHSRLYEAAAYTASQPELELVQLTSFGCGLDAVTADQVQEIIEASGRAYTLLKIDEINNLGAARIRLRSLKAAREERAGKALCKKAPYARKPLRLEKGMGEGYTLLAPQMAPLQFDLLEPVFEKYGYDFRVLKVATREDVDCGLKYVNNDACYPSILVTGQMINALISGQFDPERTALVISQTGGGCRATNYAAFIRKALVDAGFPQVPVVALSLTGIERHPGLSITPGLLADAVKALCFGDLLQTLLLRIRPYEETQGMSEAAAAHWQKVFAEVMLNRGHSVSLGRKLSGRELIRACVRAFDAIQIKDITRLPRVGVVGEILVKFHPDANNQLIRVIETEGCEAVMPGLMDFILYCFYNTVWKTRHYKNKRGLEKFVSLGISALEGFRREIRRALAKSPRGYDIPQDIRDIARGAQDYLSPGNATGEGWFLTGEMLELIHSGTPNIVCAQPFACLPNHVFGKGMIREIRRRNPQANIVAVDYDPGASEVNQLNRIKLMIATAKHRSGQGGQAPKAPAGGSTPAPSILRRAIREGGRAAAL
ncbi:MAG: acyl-CoA dehydratase activase-related protein [Eubacteriales bacterium]|nr:acyl-CoA dehydratase activase-related protein [Eubacteriales bacterium]